MFFPIIWNKWAFFINDKCGWQRMAFEDGTIIFLSIRRDIESVTVVKFSQIRFEYSFFFGVCVGKMVISPTDWKGGGEDDDDDEEGEGKDADDDEAKMGGGGGGGGGDGDDEGSCSICYKSSSLSMIMLIFMILTHVTIKQTPTTVISMKF